MSKSVASAGSQWRFTVLKAQLDQNCLDSNKFDLYVAVRVGDKTLYTSTIEAATINPEWNQNFGVTVSSET